MGKYALIFCVAAFGTFIADQNLKILFIEGVRYYSDCIDLVLVYNRGVAFSMFAFLGEWLKWLQLIMIGGIVGYFFWQRDMCTTFPGGILIGAALSNVFDRFLHGGVVDYVYWHCGFDFAVFNLADVLIDIGVLWLLLLNYKPELCKKESDEAPI